MKKQKFPTIETFNLNKEALKRLEQNSHIYSKGKFLIVVTDLEIKPVSEFKTDFVSKKEKEMVSKNIRKILEDLGLVYSEGWYLEYDNNGRVYEDTISLVFTIAKNESNIKMRFLSEKDEDRDSALGRSYGFPESAIRAYKEKEMLLPDEFPDDISEVDRKFTFFRFSRTNWKEELEWLRALIKKVKEVAPEIYNQILNA